jgi:hypothetical protein
VFSSHFCPAAAPHVGQGTLRLNFSSWLRFMVLSGNRSRTKSVPILNTYMSYLRVLKTEQLQSTFSSIL